LGRNKEGESIHDHDVRVGGGMVGGGKTEKRSVRVKRKREIETRKVDLLTGTGSWWLGKSEEGREKKGGERAKKEEDYRVRFRKRRGG